MRKIHHNHIGVPMAHRLGKLPRQWFYKFEAELPENCRQWSSRECDSYSAILRDYRKFWRISYYGYENLCPYFPRPPEGAGITVDLFIPDCDCNGNLIPNQWEWNGRKNFPLMWRESSHHENQHVYRHAMAYILRHIAVMDGQ